MDDELRQAAIAVLERNDRGGWTRPSPLLYPHQWSWDSAFVAIGLGHVDPARAVTELTSLFRAQWRNGMVPHIVFDPAVPPGSYFPGPERWASDVSVHAADGIATSGVCQPPVHAIALHRVWTAAEAAGDGSAERIRPDVIALWPKLAAWHRYLRTARDPEGSGLVSLWHPWESGLDNSPRWDPSLARVRPGELAPYTRHDLIHVADAGERPTDGEYDRYLWLVHLLHGCAYDDDIIAAHHPFRVKDVFFSALLAAADDALAALAPVAGVDHDVMVALARDADRTRGAIDDRFDPDTGLVHDLDLLSGEALPARTIAGFAPLVAGGLFARTTEMQAVLEGPSFCGAEGMRWPLPPSTAVDDPAFDPRSYWRGPVWPVMTWVLWWSLLRAGADRQARRLRDDALDQLRTTGFFEYIDPGTGEGLGSDAQSWTAAVALDWLADRDVRPVRGWVGSGPSR
jgi:hypothetical protein